MNPNAIDLLVIEDEGAARKIVLLVMRQLGLTVAEASTGREALTLVEGGLQPRMVISDFIMPGMNGAEFIEKIREAGLLPETPIYIMSGGCTQIPGAAGHIQKPIDLDYLANLVTSVLVSDH